MTGSWLTAPVAVPLLAAGVTVLTARRPRLTRAVTGAATLAVLVMAGVLLAHTAGGEVTAVRLGGWPPGVAIAFAADAFSALLLAVCALLVLVCVWYAAASGDDTHPVFHPQVLLLSTGVYGALLTADLFNLFVLIEVMLVASYVLLTWTGGRQRTAAAGTYLLVNLLASTMLLGGLAMLYGLTGTVNLGSLAGAARDDQAVALAGGVVLLALAAKAGVVPFHGWLPRAYPYAAPVVTALFSGLLTKVGVYALIRVYAVLYDGAADHLWLLLVAAWVTMVFGVLGAVGENAMRPILTFHMVSQIGYALVGLGLFRAEVLAAAVFFLIQYVLVKGALLLCAAAVEDTYGTDRLDRLGGLASREPLLALSFLVAALSLAGLPPFSGFVAKLALLRAASLEGAYVTVAIAVLVSLLTLLSMLKIWSSVFTGTFSWSADADGKASAREKPARPRPRDWLAAAPPGTGGGPGQKQQEQPRVTVPETSDADATAEPPRARAGVVLPVAVLAGFSVLLGIGAQPLLDLAGTAAAGLADPTTWVTAVTGA